MSPWSATCSAPRERSSFIRASSPGDGPTSTAAIRAFSPRVRPSRASLRHVACPIPLAAPVTSTRMVPSRSLLLAGLLFWWRFRRCRSARRTRPALRGRVSARSAGTPDLDLGAGHEPRCAVAHDRLAGLEPFPDDRLAALRPLHGDLAHVDRGVVLDDEHVLALLLPALDCRRRNHDRFRIHREGQVDVDELTRPESLLFVLERRLEPDGSSGLIDRVVDERDHALERLWLAGGKRADLERAIR